MSVRPGKPGVVVIVGRYIGMVGLRVGFAACELFGNSVHHVLDWSECSGHRGKVSGEVF